MNPDFSKAEKRFVRQVANVAWDRQLRDSLTGLYGLIESMQKGDKTAFDVDDAINEHHNNVSQRLYREFSTNKTWHPVVNAYIDGVLTDADFNDAPPGVRSELARSVSLHCAINGIDPSTFTPGGG